MSTIQIVAMVVIATGLGGFVVNIGMLIRNEWVYKHRIKLRGTPLYDKLPTYDEMMARWWVWNIKAFLKP